MIAKIVQTFFYLVIIVTITKTEIDHDVNKIITIDQIAENLVNLLGVNLENSTNKRFKELRDKISKINSLTIDKQKYSELIHNETVNYNLSETNFYSALNDVKDKFSFLSENEPKNLYLTLKQKMNRDDILNIIAANGQGGRIHQSARKLMGEDMFKADVDDFMVEDMVDKMIAEEPNDNHKFDKDDYTSKYWDPQSELEDRIQSSKYNGRRIFRGERTTVRYYPFMVSIHILGRFWCGGVIYWHDLVLTSAACLQLMHNNRFYRENPRTLQVRIGSNHSRIGGEMVDAAEVYFHPSYNPRTLQNNIAVIRLRRHLFFTYHRIPKLIDISHENHLVPATAEVLLLGWGVTKTSQKMSFEPVFLQRKLLPVYPNKFCKEVYGDKFITSTMFCAGTMTTGEGACDHDAGGPAVLGGHLVGIISFGPTVCGFPNAPTVFTLIGAYSDWIETVNETMPSYYRGKKQTTTTTPKSINYYIPKVTSTKEPPLRPLNLNLVTDVLSSIGTETLPATEKATEASPIPAGRMALKKNKKKKKSRYGDMDLLADSFVNKDLI